jgi:hypothetical protein
MVSAEGIESITKRSFNDMQGPRMTPKVMEVNTNPKNRAQTERKRFFGEIAIDQNVSALLDLQEGRVTT